MKRINYLLVCLACSLAFFISACGTMTEEIKNDWKSPLDVSNKTLPAFGVARIKSSVTPRSIAGGHYEGLLRIKQGTYRAGGSISETILKSYSEIMQEELNKAGYKTTGRKGGLFEDDDILRTRLLIGGDIVNGTIDTYGKYAGNRSEASLVIQWEVYDKQKKEVIYSKETTGSAKLRGINLEVITLALIGSFREFLSSESLIHILARDGATPGY